MTDEDGRVLVLVAGEGRKRRPVEEERIPIKDLYCTDYFSKKQRFAEELGDAWGVLSAMFGVVNPGRLVGYYSQTIDDIGRGSCRKLAHEVLDLPYLTTDDDVVLLGGRSVADPFSLAWPEPMRDQLSKPFQFIYEIDERMRWMDKAIEEGDPLLPPEEAGVRTCLDAEEEYPPQPIPDDAES